jgi:hypothetical protein
MHVETPNSEIVSAAVTIPERMTDQDEGLKKTGVE